MIAIVIPAYDMHHQGVHFLRRALESINKQKQIDFSQMMVVVSDHSVNFAIEKFLKGYQTPFQLQYVRNYTHFGNISQNLNHAIEFVLQNSPASYIKVLFQDDYLLADDYLAQILHITQETKPDAIITGATHSTDGQTYFNPIAPQNNPFLIFGQNTISSPSTLTLSRQVCEQERCDEDVRLFMDVDWYYRIFKSYSSIVYAPDLFVVNGVWDGQMQHQFDAQSFTKELAYVLSKYEADQLRGQIPNYLTLLHEQYPEHAKLIDPLVQPLMETLNSRTTHLTEQCSDIKHSNIDVILTTQNAAQFINFSIRNALLQSIPPRTIYVVDTHSSDETAKMVGSIYAQIPTVRFISSASASLGLAREEGLTLSDASYVAFLESTQENHPRWSSNYLEQQIAHLKNQPQAIGSLGTIQTSEPANNTFPLLIQLPACGYASNLLIKREAALSDNRFLEQLRLAEEYQQWQFFSTLCSFSSAAQALTHTSASSSLATQLGSESYIKQCRKIFAWWSKNLQAILSNPKMLTLIRQAFTGAASAPKLSLIQRLSILHDTYQGLIPTLHAQLFDSACGSYYSLVLEVMFEHFKQLWSCCKKEASKFPVVVKVHQIFSR